MTLTAGNLVLANPMVCTNTAKGDNKLYSDAKGVVPSLDLRFASQKNLNDYMTATPLVDHQRSMSGSNLSPGTFINSNGLIETAKVNQFSNSIFGAGWTANNISVKSTDNLAPDGTYTAVVIGDATGTVATSRLAAVLNLVGNGVQTFSFYAKGTTTGQSAFFDYFDTGVNRIRASFSLDTGVITYGIVSGDAIAATENVGNGWWRLKLTLTPIGTSTYQWRVGNNLSGDIYIWGAQVEEGTTASTYIPTTTVPSAAPRFDHDPATGESLGLLIEESRTNLFTYSESFDNFVKADCSITSNVITAPDGTLTGDKFVANNGSAVAYLFSGGTPTATGTYTSTIYAKAAELSALRISAFSVEDGEDTTIFNLSNGTITSGSGTIVPAGNGWYRCGLTKTWTGLSSAQVQIARNTVTGDGVSGIYIWGAQLELGSFPTSYIPTTTTALTRSADNASITGSNFSSWYNQGKGTFLTNYTLTNTSTGYALKTDDTTSSNVISFITNSNAVLINTSGAQQYLNSIAAPSIGTNMSVALSYETNNVNSAFNGSVGVVDTSASIPVVTQLRNTGNTIGPISRLTYFPDRLPDATLQTITAS